LAINPHISGLALPSRSVELSLNYLNENGNASLPTPKQEEFHLMMNHPDPVKRKKHGVFAGGFGTGKTDAFVIEALAQTLLIPGNLGLMGRKTIDSFRKSTLETVLRLAPAGSIIRHNKTEHEIEFINKSKIVYMQLDAGREAVDRIKSMNLGWFGVDQLEEIDQEVYLAAQGRLRRKGTNRCDFHTVNPAGHDWIWRIWKAGEAPLGEIDEYGMVESVTWPENVDPPYTEADVAAHSDNPYLPPDYIRSLLAYPDRWRKRFVYCHWDSFEGLVWPEFNENMHLKQRFTIPKSWPRYVIMDYGYRNPTAILWMAVNPKSGQIYVYDSHYQAEWRIQDHVPVIRAKCGRDVITDWLADPSISKQGFDGKTISSEYEKFNIFWNPANNDVGAGINRVGEYFTPDESDKCRIYIFSDLPNINEFLKEIGSYVWKDIRVGSDGADPEAPKKKNDHFMDVLRYGVMWIHERVMVRKQTSKDGWDEVWDNAWSMADNANYDWVSMT
jgi:hypothetical protein